MFIYITDNNGRLIEFMKQGSSRFNLWNDIIDRDLSTFHKLPQLKLLKVQVHYLYEKIEDRLKILIEENRRLPKDYPEWEGRFVENDIFVEMYLFGEKHMLCNSGRENNIIFLGNILCFLQEYRDKYFFEIIGSSHSEINEILKINGSS